MDADGVWNMPNIYLLFSQSYPNMIYKEVGPFEKIVVDSDGIGIDKPKCIDMVVGYEGNKLTIDPDFAKEHDIPDGEWSDVEITAK